MIPKMMKLAKVHLIYLSVIAMVWGVGATELLAKSKTKTPSSDAKTNLKGLEKSPILKNYLNFYQAQEKLEKKDNKAAIALLEKLLAETGISHHLKTKAATVLGRAYCQTHEKDKAIRYYSHVIESESQKDSLVPFWRLEQARCFSELGQKNEALQSLRTLYLNDSQGQISEAVLKILTELKAKNFISPSEHENKGRRLFSTRPELAAMSLAAAAEAYPGHTPLLLLQDLAEAYFRSRQYPEASRAYEQLRSTYPGAWNETMELNLAQSYARSDQFDEAISTYQSMYGSRNQSAGTLDYKIAFLFMDKGDLKEANRRFEEILSASPTHPQRERINWFLAWNHYQLKNYDQASLYLDILSANFPRGAYGRRAPYWQARIAEKRGNSQAARTLYQEIAASVPESYYGLLSGWRLGGNFPTELKTPLPINHSSRSLLASVSLPQQDKARLQALLEAGLTDDFLGELQEYLSSRTQAEFLSNAERQGYPRPYQTWVDFFSARYQVPTALIYAIMREESRFNPSVVSPANAIGLMQIIPPTGLEIAQDLGRLGFESTWLTQPLVNAEFGTYYLGKNLKRFERNKTATIASYNAGPNAVSRWLNARPNREWDEFVEEIPYTETNNYVKKVMVSYQRYGGM